MWGSYLHSGSQPVFKAEPEGLTWERATLGVPQDGDGGPSQEARVTGEEEFTWYLQPSASPVLMSLDATPPLAHLMIPVQYDATNIY